MHPLDPYRVATLLIRQMGADAAEDHARDRQLELLGEHDTAVADAWVQVRAAIRYQKPLSVTHWPISLAGKF